MQTKPSVLARIATTLLTLISFGAIAAPLDNWNWRNPLPNGNPQLGPQALNAITYAAGEFVAVGNSGVVSISTDSTNWSQNATATTNNLHGLVYAAGEFLAVGDGGVVETSADGSNWVLQHSGTTSPLIAVAYGNGRFVAAGTNFVIESQNSSTWTTASAPWSMKPYFVTTAGSVLAGGSNGFVAVAGDTQAYFSADGLTWTGQTLTAPGSVFLGGASLMNDMVTYWKGNFYIGSGRYASSMSADMFVFASADGINWGTNYLGNQYTGTGGFIYNFFMASSNYLVAAGTAGYTPFLQYSPDGANWSQTNDGPGISTSYGMTAGAYGNGSYVMTYSQSSPPPIFVSDDGITWTNRQKEPVPPVGPAYTFTCIASNSGVDIAVSANLVGISSNGLSYVVASNTPPLSSVLSFSNGFVGVGTVGTIYVSTNGLSWTLRNSGTANNLHGVTAGNGLLVAVGDAGSIQTSPSGLIWTSRSSGTSLPLYSVACSNGVFVTVGQEGTVLTSPDGINWTGQYSAVLSNLVSVTYGSAGFLAVGPGGTIVTSSDGVNWVTQNPGTTASFESVTFGNGYYLATGNNGVAMTSPDGVNWTARNVGVSGGQNLYGSAFFNNRFEIVGANGTILESDPIAPLFDFQMTRAGGKNAFTMFAPQGSNFRLQSCITLLSGWSDVASFNNAASITMWTNNQTGLNQQFYRLVSP